MTEFIFSCIYLFFPHQPVADGFHTLVLRVGVYSQIPNNESRVFTDPSPLSDILLVFFSAVPLRSSGTVWCLTLSSRLKTPPPRLKPRIKQVQNR